MSGLPSPDMARRCAFLLKENREKRIEITRLRDVIEKATTKLTEEERQVTINVREIDKLFEQADLKYAGNTGYEKRLAWFIEELTDQARKLS